MGSGQHLSVVAVIALIKIEDLTLGASGNASLIEVGQSFDVVVFCAVRNAYTTQCQIHCHTVIFI